jgi:4-alpha-glucanotransferase
MVKVTDPELARRAEAAGIALSYRDWQERDVTVGADTVAAILAALEAAPLARSSAADVPVVAPAACAAPGAGAAGAEPPGAEPARPDWERPRQPQRREWGFTVQLYSLRSRASWGHGDLRDLAELAAWSGSELGAGFVLINPLHAAEPLPPVSNSPYLPMTRRFTSPLYLRIEDIPEYRRLTGQQRGQIEALAAPLLAASTGPDLIDRDAVWTAKRAALEIIYGVPLAAARRRELDRYRRREGAELDAWAAWCALAEQHGSDWRRWPAPARRQPAAARGPGLAATADFHAWVQWLADEQLASAQRAALAAGMDIGIIGDLAVGAHPGGADAWAHQDLLVPGISVGAPPDAYNQLGQDWSQPPWHPQRLAAAGYRPLAELYASGLRHAGGLRADHVMGMMRLWCIPDGMPPDRGAYLHYDHRAAVRALAGAAGRAGALAIGEDLGTVDPWIRRYLARHGVLGTSMLWFAHDRRGAPLPPGRWRRACMATVGTHDLPPVSGFVTGEQLRQRDRLGLLRNPAAERESVRLMLHRWQLALVRQCLLPAGRRPGPGELTVALYAYLARTPSVLIGVSLADAVGDRRTQNIPGTVDEYPNWRVPLCDGTGQPVLLEDLPGLPLLRAVTRAARPVS